METFDFKGLTLDDSIRFLVSKFALAGETQEIDRVMVEFAKRYHENNPNAFANWSTTFFSMLFANWKKTKKKKKKKRNEMKKR